MKTAMKEFRNVLINIFPSYLHKKVRKTSDVKMVKIMDMMKNRIHFYEDLLNHTYFFEEPTYDSSIKSFKKKLTQPTSTKIEILEDLKLLFKASVIENEENQEYDKDHFNKICSLYLFENADRNFKNEDIFFLLRFAITGNPVGASTGEICEVIGISEVIQRCKNAIDYLHTEDQK